MSNAVDAVKDFNPKVALEALNCVEILVRHHKHDFLPLANMTFDVLLGELCDFKVSMRFKKSIELLFLSIALLTTSEFDLCRVVSATAASRCS